MDAKRQKAMSQEELEQANTEEAARLKAIADAEEAALLQQQAEAEREERQIPIPECPDNIFELKECIPGSNEGNYAYPLTNDPQYTNADPDILERAIQDLVSLGLVRTAETGYCNKDNLISGFSNPSRESSGEVKLKRAPTHRISVDKTAFTHWFNTSMEQLKSGPIHEMITRLKANCQQKKSDECKFAAETCVAKSSTACHYDQKLELLITVLANLGYTLGDFPWLIKLLLFDIGPGSMFRDMPDEVFEDYIAAATYVQGTYGYRLTPDEYFEFLTLKKQAEVKGEIPLTIDVFLRSRSIIRATYTANEKENFKKIKETMDFLYDIQYGRDTDSYENTDINAMLVVLKNSEKININIPFILRDIRGGIVHWANIVFKGYLCIGPFSNKKCYLMPIYGIHTAWGQGGQGGFYFEPTSNHLTEIELIRLICYLNNDDKTHYQQEYSIYIESLFNKAFFRQEAAKAVLPKDMSKEKEKEKEAMQKAVWQRATTYTHKDINNLNFAYFTLKDGTTHVSEALQNLVAQTLSLRGIPVPNPSLGGSKNKIKKTNKRRTNKRRKTTKRRKTNKRRKQRQRRTNKRRRI
jgi:hypothetical protein